MVFKLGDNASVRLDKAGRIRTEPTAGIGHADPESVIGGVGLHGLPHDLRVDAGALLTGVIEGLKNALDTFFVQGPVQFRKPKVKADQQRAFDAVDVEMHKMIAGGIMVKVDFRAEAFIIAIDEFAVG